MVCTNVPDCADQRKRARPASVRVDASEWVDYMHLGKVDGEWKIINVLWELLPASR
jgi:hypothetical protein